MMVDSKFWEAYIQYSKYNIKFYQESSSSVKIISKNMVVNLDAHSFSLKDINQSRFVQLAFCQEHLFSWISIISNSQ